MKNRFKPIAWMLTVALVVFGQSTGGAHHDLTRYTVGGINAKVVAATPLLTPAGGTGNFHVLFVIVEMTASGSITVGATVSIGTNASTYNNIIPATVLGTAANAMAVLTPAASTLSTTTGIQANVSVAATGTSGTIAVTLIGYYQ